MHGTTGLLLLSVLLFARLNLAAVKYYVKPDPPQTSQCPTGKPCFTLRDYSFNYSSQISNRADNVSLIFLPGSYNVIKTTIMRIMNVEVLNVTGIGRPIIRIHRSAFNKVFFENITTICIQGVQFLGKQGKYGMGHLYMTIKDTLKIDNTLFQRISLSILGSRKKVIITNSKFISSKIPIRKKVNFNTNFTIILYQTEFYRESSFVAYTGYRKPPIFAKIIATETKWLGSRALMLVLYDHDTLSLELHNSTCLPICVDAKIQGSRVSLFLYFFRSILDCICFTYVSKYSTAKHLQIAV